MNLCPLSCSDVLLQVRETSIGFPYPFHLKHGTVRSATHHGRPSQHGCQQDGVLHHGVTVPLLPAPALGLGRTERPGNRRIAARSRSCPLYALWVSLKHPWETLTCAKSLQIIAFAKLLMAVFDYAAFVCLKASTLPPVGRESSTWLQSCQCRWKYEHSLLVCTSFSVLLAMHL